MPVRYGTPLQRADGTRVPLSDGRPVREQVTQGTLGGGAPLGVLGSVAAQAIVGEAFADPAAGTREAVSGT
jgi:hypothetical protein